MKNVLTEMKLLIAVILLTLGQVIAIDIQCEFKFARNELHRDFERYKCYARSVLFVANETKVERVSGTHITGKTISDVTMFHSDKNLFNKFPRNLRDFFPNMAMVDIYEAGLTEITRLDFTQFGDRLKSVWLMRNGIKRITSDLFLDNPNIEWINLSENDIVHVEMGAFTGYKKLSKLFFKTNPCYNGATSELSKVDQLARNIERLCVSAAYRQHKAEALARKGIKADTVVAVTEKAKTVETRVEVEEVIQAVNVTALKAELENKQIEEENLRTNMTQFSEIVKGQNQEITQIKLKIQKLKEEKQEEFNEYKTKINGLTEQIQSRDAIITNVNTLMERMKQELVAACKT